MRYIAANDLKLFYETSGDPAHPPVLLIAGLGVQLTDWADYFLEPLVEAGHFVIRFDNRDIGLSTTFEGAVNDPQVVMAALEAGEDPGVAYTLADMAADAAALLDALDIDAAHIVGVSMGGMIAQNLALQFPTKVLTLTSIMSTTGAGDVGQPTADAMAAITSAAPGTERSEMIAHNMQNAQVWASPGHFDTERMRKLFEDAWDRAGGPQAENTGRHFCAIVASPPRDEALASIAAPTLVIHGTADTLVTTSGGHRTAESIPGSSLMIVDGMGHDLVPAFVPEIVQAIGDLVAGVTAA